MSGIRGKNTKPELIVRQGLHHRGYRYRLHNRNLPGTPDLTLPKHKAVIFVNGCFWHMHRCGLFKMPSTSQEWWSRKLERNVEIDKQAIEALRASGWRVLVVWECCLKGKARMSKEALLDTICEWIDSNEVFAEIEGLRRNDPH